MAKIWSDSEKELLINKVKLGEQRKQLAKLIGTLQRQ